MNFKRLIEDITTNIDMLTAQDNVFTKYIEEAKTENKRIIMIDFILSEISLNKQEGILFKKITITLFSSKKDMLKPKTLTFQPLIEALKFIGLPGADIYEKHKEVYSEKFIKMKFSGKNCNDRVKYNKKYLLKISNSLLGLYMELQSKKGLNIRKLQYLTQKKQEEILLMFLEGNETKRLEARKILRNIEIPKEKNDWIIRILEKLKKMDDPPPNSSKILS